jgi:hypothetical protein
MTKSRMIKCCAFAIALCVLLPLLVYAVPTYDPSVDINGDGKIDGKDISLAAKLFGTFTTPLPAPPGFTDVWTGGQYWMTGGDDPDALYKGVDNFYVFSTNGWGAPSSWPSVTYSVLLAHTDDWVVYDIITSVTAFLDDVNLTLRNLKTPSLSETPPGTPVSIWVWTGSYPNVVPTQSHDMDLDTTVFQQIGSVTIAPPGTWVAYYLSVPLSIRNALGERNQYYIAVHLDNGEMIAPGIDRNVEIGWIKLYVP